MNDFAVYQKDVSFLGDVTLKKLTRDTTFNRAHDKYRELTQKGIKNLVILKNVY